MEEQNPFPRHSCRLALKPPLQPEVTSGRRRRSRSAESSTIRTSSETSVSHNPELSQFVSTHLGSSTVVVKPAPKIEENRYQRLINKPLRGGNLQYIT